MIDSIQLLDQPGRSLGDTSDHPDARRHERSPLWSAVAMVAVISIGSAINGFSTSYTEQAATNPSPTTGRTLSELDVVELCRVEMLNLGIHRYTVPVWIPDRHGDNLQTRQPWRVGDTVKVLPERRARGSSGPAHYDDTVACTIPAQ